MVARLTNEKLLRYVPDAVGCVRGGTKTEVMNLLFPRHGDLELLIYWRRIALIGLLCVVVTVVTVVHFFYFEDGQ